MCWSVRVVLASLGCFVTVRVSAADQAWNVRLVGKFRAECEAVYVVGRYAYIGDGTHLRVLDVSNPTTPVSVGLLGLPGPFVEGIHVSETLACVADGTAGLQLVDVTNPTSPTLLGSYDTPGYARDIFVSRGLAYVADGYSGLQIVDVTNPSSPTLRGFYNTPGYAADVFVANGMAYIADRSSLQIIDVANPSSPTFRSSYGEHDWDEIWNVFVFNGIAFLSDSEVTYPVPPFFRLYFLSVDVRNPDAPRFLGRYSTATGSAAGSVYISYGLAYVVFGGFRVLDIRNSCAPQLYGYYDPTGVPFPGEGEVFACDDLVYMGTRYDGLWIFQYTGPYTPVVLWFFYR